MTALETIPSSPATTGQPSAALAWAQTHALRATADLLDRIGQPGLLVTVAGDQISILVPDHLGSRARRAAVVARLAATVGARPTRTRAHHQPGLGAGLGWIEAQGVLAGHPVHIFTPVPTATTTATTKEPTP